VVERGEAIGLNIVEEESVPALFQDGVPIPLPLRTIEFPAQIEISPPAFTLGAKLTVIVKVTEFPTQPLAFGVTVIVAEIGFVTVFDATKGGIAPDPDAPKPMLVLLFVQL
jgi:hypothetical protein